MSDKEWELKKKKRKITNQIVPVRFYTIEYKFHVEYFIKINSQLELVGYRRRCCRMQISLTLFKLEVNLNVSSDLFSMVLLLLTLLSHFSQSMKSLNAQRKALNDLNRILFIVIKVTTRIVRFWEHILLTDTLQTTFERNGYSYTRVLTHPLYFCISALRFNARSSTSIIPLPFRLGAWHFRIVSQRTNFVERRLFTIFSLGCFQCISRRKTVGVNAA